MAWSLLLYRKERPQVAATRAHTTCRARRRTTLCVCLVASELSLGGGPPGHHPASLHSEGNAEYRRYARQAMDLPGAGPSSPALYCLVAVVEGQDASATRRGGRLSAQHLPGGALDPGHRPRGKTLPGNMEIQWKRDTSTPGVPPREGGSFPGRHPGTIYRRTYPARF